MLGLSLPSIVAWAASKMGRPPEEVQVDAVRTTAPEGLISVGVAASTLASVLAAQGATILVSTPGVLPATTPEPIEQLAARLTALEVGNKALCADNTAMRKDLDVTKKDLDVTKKDLDVTKKELGTTIQRLDAVAVDRVLGAANEVNMWRTGKQPLAVELNTYFTKGLASTSPQKRGWFEEFIASVSLDLERNVTAGELDALSQVRNIAAHCQTLRELNLMVKNALMLISPSMEESIDSRKDDAEISTVKLAIVMLRHYEQLKSHFPPLRESGK